MKNNHFNIAIDGPAGAGKSTIAKAVAKRLGFVYVDTGAMYRALGLHFLRNQLPAEDEAAISEACHLADIVIRYEEGSQQIFLNGENITNQIRTEEVGNMASATSAYPAVRTYLLKLQRSLAANSDVIMDGRDIGTLILPDADVKIFLTASPYIRARRRYAELTGNGIQCDFKKIEKDITDRDKRDTNREIAPLRQAEDAILLDSSMMSIEEVVDAIIQIATEHGLGNETSQSQLSQRGAV